MNTKEIKRWDHYQKLLSENQSVRQNEFTTILNILKPKNGEVIIEIGPGNGFVTKAIADKIGYGGKIYAAEIKNNNFSRLIESNDKGLPIIPIFLDRTRQNFLPKEFENFFDANVSLATLHHFDNTIEQTGEKGRISFLRESKRVLKHGGRIVICDVQFGTETQKYLYAINDPLHYSPFGHPHDFFTKERIYELMQQEGFFNISISIVKTPWVFKDESHARSFWHSYLNAKCTEDETFEIVRTFLGAKKVGNHFETGWSIMCITAIKK